MKIISLLISFLILNSFLSNILKNNQSQTIVQNNDNTQDKKISHIISDNQDSRQLDDNNEKNLNGQKTQQLNKNSQIKVIEQNKSLKSNRILPTRKPFQFINLNGSSSITPKENPKKSLLDLYVGESFNVIFINKDQDDTKEHYSEKLDDGEAYDYSANDFHPENYNKVKLAIDDQNYVLTTLNFEEPEIFIFYFVDRSKKMIEIVVIDTQFPHGENIIQQHDTFMTGFSDKFDLIFKYGDQEDEEPNGSDTFEYGTLSFKPTQQSQKIKNIDFDKKLMNPTNVTIELKMN